MKNVVIFDRFYKQKSFFPNLGILTHSVDEIYSEKSTFRRAGNYTELAVIESRGKLDDVTITTISF